MFATARKEAKKQISHKNLNENNNLAIPLQYLPESYSLSQLHDDLVSTEASQSRQDELEDLLILNSCLGDSRRLKRQDDGVKSIDSLSSWISKAILPDGSFVATDETADDTSSASRQRALILTRHAATLGLTSLTNLQELKRTSDSSPTNQDLDPSILLSLLAFASPQDPWSSPLTLSISTTLLSPHTTQLTAPAFITATILQSFIRPLFQKSKPSTITPSSRAAIPSSAPPKKFDLREIDRSSKPWKYEKPYSLTIFSWAVEHSSSETILSSTWPLLIPPLLTLLDDPSTAIRSRGLKILTTLLPKLSSKHLSQTGLGNVFEDAVFPTLLYLPTITPLEESVVLVPAAYEALFALCDVRFPASDSNENGDGKERTKFLDKLLRKGILAGYAYASEHPSIVEILLIQTKLLIDKMGITSVKHLKDLIPIISTVLTDPFGASKPSLLLAGLRCLQSLILNAWPRVREEGSRIEIVRGLVVCWRMVCEDGKAGEGLKNEIKNTGRLLVKAVGGEVDMKEELRPLFEVDGSVGEVFGIDFSQESNTR